MLGKLIKHELRATARIMLPLYAALVLLAALANFSIKVFGSADSTFLNILNGLIVFLYGLAAFAAGVMALVIMISRFRTNLLGDEGYLMFTLPVSIHGHIWSKIIVSVLWFVSTAVTEAIAAFCLVFKADQVQFYLRQIGDLFGTIFAQFDVNYALIAVEFLLAVLVGGVTICLLFYAAMAIGHSFPNRKVLNSVIFFLVLQFAAQLVGTVGVEILSHIDFDLSHLTEMGVANLAMWSFIAVELIYGAAFYILTTWSLKRRLNLE